MGFLDGLFGRDDAATPAPAATPANFRTRLGAARRDFERLTRSLSPDLSPAVYEQARQLDDLAREFLAELGDSDARVEDDIALIRILGDFAPTTLRTYADLPEAAKTADAEATIVRHLTTYQRELEASVAAEHNRAITALAVHDAFVSSRYTEGPTLP